MDVHNESVKQKGGRDLYTADVWCCIADSLSLSTRELQITQGVFDDMPEKAIARELGISPHTVHTHLDRLYHKLQVSSRVALVVRIAQCHCFLCQQPDSVVPPLCHHHVAKRCPF